MKIELFFFSSRRRHTRSVSAFLLNRSSDLRRSLLLALLGKIGVFHNRRNASSRLLLLISKHRSEERRVGKECSFRWMQYYCRRKWSNISENKNIIMKLRFMAR